ncbi:MAG: hypothetical protein ACE5GM_03825 [bacterium]
MARGKGDEEVLQLDSFLDIITNTIGILVLMCCMTAININDITYIVRTPFIHHSTKMPVFFECRNNHVSHIDKEDIEAKINMRINELSKNNDQLTPGKILSLLEGEKIGNEYYHLDLPKLFLENIFVLIPRAAEIGATSSDLKKPSSSLNQMAMSLDREKFFAFFLVRPDSFEVYRAARKVFWDNSIEVGWEPLESGKFISFGQQGRKPKID